MRSPTSKILQLSIFHLSLSGQAPELAPELFWIDFMLKDSDPVYEYHWNVILVLRQGARIAFNVDFTQLELVQASSREDRSFGFFTEVTARSAINNDD